MTFDMNFALSRILSFAHFAVAVGPFRISESRANGNTQNASFVVALKLSELEPCELLKNSTKNHSFSEYTSIRNV